LARNLTFGSFRATSAGYAPPEIGVLTAVPSGQPGPILARAEVQVEPQDSIVVVFLAGRSNSTTQPHTFISRAVRPWYPQAPPTSLLYPCGLLFANMLPEADFADLNVSGVRVFSRVAYGEVAASPVQIMPSAGPIIATSSDTGAVLAQVSATPCGFYPDEAFLAVVEGHGTIDFVPYGQG
jgi:hypothetical protein